MGLITSVADVVVTPAHIKPGDGFTITCNITAGSTAVTGFTCALYGQIGGVNYLISGLLNGTSISANATKAVTITGTASAAAAQPDGRATAFAAGAEAGVHDVRLFFGFRNVTKQLGEESASVGYFMYETEDVAGAFGKAYNPSIDRLVIERATYDSEANVFRPDDEGVRALVSCVLSMDDPEDGQHFACTLTWGANTAAICHSGSMSIHNRNTDRWSYCDRAWYGDGMARNIWPLFDYEFAKGVETEITCTYGDDYEADTVVFKIRAAFANLNLSGTGMGVAIGKFSGSTEGNPLFEVAEEYRSIFGGDVAIPAGKLLKMVTVTASGTMSTSTPTMSKTKAVDAGSGWTPIAIAGVMASNSFCVIYKALLNSSGEVEMSCRYNGSSSGISITLTADVLCLHTALT